MVSFSSLEGEPLGSSCCWLHVMVHSVIWTAAVGCELIVFVSVTLLMMVVEESE